MDKSEIFAALAADPTNRTLQLIYADWLEEHGDPLCVEWRKPLGWHTHSVNDEQKGDRPFIGAGYRNLRGNGTGHGLKNNDEHCGEGDGYGAGADAIWPSSSSIRRQGDGRGLGFANGAFNGNGCGTGMSYYGFIDGSGGRANQTIHLGNAVIYSGFAAGKF